MIVTRAVATVAVPASGAATAVGARVASGAAIVTRVVATAVAAATGAAIAVGVRVASGAVIVTRAVATVAVPASGVIETLAAVPASAVATATLVAATGVGVRAATVAAPASVAVTATSGIGAIGRTGTANTAIGVHARATATVRSGVRDRDRASSAGKAASTARGPAVPGSRRRTALPAVARRQRRPRRDGDRREAASREGGGYGGGEGRVGGYRPRRDDPGFERQVVDQGFEGTEDREEATVRVGDPVLADDIDPREFDNEVRTELRSLARPVAEKVARQLVATGQLIDDDPKLALAHALAARRLASRIAAVREAVGLAAYHAGEWQTAIAELRTYHRMSGRQTHLAVLADCERALGRPERAIDLFRAADRSQLDAEEVDRAADRGGRRPGRPGPERRGGGDAPGSRADLDAGRAVGGAAAVRVRGRAARAWVGGRRHGSGSPARRTSTRS